MNDQERRLWVLNDEGLYNWFQSERYRYTILQFIQQYRSELTAIINEYMGR